MRRTEVELNRRASTPQYWFNKSTDLRAAAGALWYCMDQPRNLQVTRELVLGDGFSMAVATRPVYLMLCGLSLELVYKAILVAIGKEPPPRHDLCKLAAAAGIPTTKKQQQVLSLLTESIIWDGKYPTPILRKYQATENVPAISRNLLFDKRQLGSLFVFQPKKPDPLGWREFSLIWSAGATTFFKHSSSPGYTA